MQKIDLVWTRLVEVVDASRVEKRLPVNMSLDMRSTYAPWNCLGTTGLDQANLMRQTTVSDCSSLRSDDDGQLLCSWPWLWLVLSLRWYLPRSEVRSAYHLDMIFAKLQRTREIADEGAECRSGTMKLCSLGDMVDGYLHERMQQSFPKKAIHT